MGLNMRDLQKLLALGAAMLPLVFGWTSVAGQSTYTAFSACINQTLERITCPGNGSMMYTAGDMATGTIPNCGLPFFEPATAEVLNRTKIKLLHPNIVITNTTVIPLAARLSGWMQYPLGVDVIDSVAWTKEPYREFTEVSKAGVREAWFLDPVLTADMADKPVSALQDISQLVLQDQNLNWNGFGTFFRRFASVYDGKVVGLPVSAAIMLLYYRRDFFDARGIPVPATWEEVVDIAERYNGTDLDGSGRGAWGFCMSRQPKCYNGYTFQTIQVPFMQSGGTSQGFHFDPDTMTPLVNSTGTRRAAELYRRLSRYTAPTEPVACLPVSLAFVSGKCLMAVGTTLHFKYATFNNSLNNMTRVRGKTGTAVLPGSFEVMNRTTGQMVRCTPETCPYGKWHTLQNGSRAWVNAAPYAGRGAFTYAINRHREPHLQYMAYRLCARRVYADAMWPSVLSATAETTPVRTEMVDPANVGRYTAAGYDRDDTLLFMKAVSDTMEHQNIALNLRIYGALEYYLAVDAASVALSDTDRDIDQILAQAQADIVRLYSDVTSEWLKQRYWKSIDRRLPAPPPPPGGGMDARTRVGLGVGVGVGGGLLLIGVVVLVGVAVLSPALVAARQRKAYVPVASPECTLVVTDMEGSTTLWETFPGEVMQAALQTHDSIVRRVLVRHKGYESATEGDSFVLAFPDPLHALRFGLELQVELMAADWPAVLLTDSDLCRPVYAAPRVATKDKDPRDKDAQALFCRSGTFRPPPPASRMHSPDPAGPRAAGTAPPTSIPITDAASAPAAGFNHIRGIAAALAASAANVAGRGTGATAAAAAATTLTSGRARSGTSPLQPRALQAPSHQQAGGHQTPVWLQQQQQQQRHQHQQEQESQASCGGPVPVGASLSEMTEPYVLGGASVGSRSSLGVAGQTVTAIASGGDGGVSSGADAAMAPMLPAAPPQQQHLPRPLVSPPLPLRVSTLSGSPRIIRVLQPSEASGVEHGCGGSAESCNGGGAGPVSLAGPSFDNVAATTAASSAADVVGSAAAVTNAAGALNSEQVSSLHEQQRQSPLQQQQQERSLCRLLVVEGAAGDYSPCSSVERGVSMGLQLSGVLPALKSGAVASGGPAAVGAAAAAATAAAAGAAKTAAPPAATVAATTALGANGSSGGAADTRSWGGEAAAAWQLLMGPAPGAVTVYRGLRIRIGLHAGVQPGELARNRASSRITFSGQAIRMAKAVADAAHGGMIVLSDTSASQLLGSPETAALLSSEGTEVWHLGRVKLADDLRDVEMFQVVTPSLSPRLALQQPLRIQSQLLPGVLSAPAGCVALVRLHVSGLGMLRVSDPELAAEVSSVLEELLLHSLPALGGYLSEARQGGVEGISVAFTDPLRAVAWALAVQADMLHWNWSAELLQSEAFETITIDAFSSSFTSPLHDIGVGGGLETAVPLATAAAIPAASEIAVAEPAALGKGPSPWLYGSPLAASTGALTPAALSFSSQAGPRPSAAGASSVRAQAVMRAASGSFSSLSGRLPVVTTGGSAHTGAIGTGGVGGCRSISSPRPSMQHASRKEAAPTSFAFSALHHRSQKYVAWGPVRVRMLDSESQVPSLLSPLQAPTEPPKAGSGSVAGSPTCTTSGMAPTSRKVLQPHMRHLSLPSSFMRRARKSQEGMAGEGVSGAAGGQVVDVEQGRLGEDVGNGERQEESPSMRTILGVVAGQHMEGGDGGAAAAATTTIMVTASAAPTAITKTPAVLLPAAADTDAIAGLAASTAGNALPATGGVTSPWQDSTTVTVVLEQPLSLQPSAAESTVTAATLSAAAATPADCTIEPSLALSPPSFDTTSTAGMGALRVQGQVLFRGPRIKAVVDFGGVSTEICRATGRLLYRGRTAKQLSKLMSSAKWGQVLCTAAVYWHAAKAVTAIGVSMAPVAAAGIVQTTAAGGRRKAVAPVAAGRPSSVVTVASGGSIGGGTASQLPLNMVDLPPGANTAVPNKKAQLYLCTLVPHHRREPTGVHV